MKAKITCGRCEKEEEIDMQDSVITSLEHNGWGLLFYDDEEIPLCESCCRKLPHETTKEPKEKDKMELKLGEEEK